MMAWSWILAWPLLVAQVDLHTITGDAGLHAIVGNGALTAGFNVNGQLVTYKWPSPGYFDQLHYLVAPDGARSPDQGAMWVVEVDGQLQWLAEGSGLECRWGNGEPGFAAVELHDPRRQLSYRIDAFVAAENVLAVQLRVSGAATLPRIFWYANFAPCTRVVEQFPVADWLLDPWNDFGAFAVDGGKLMIHFRPSDPGQHEWDRVMRMVREHRSSGEWSVFPDGVYIAYGAAQPVNAFQCGHQNAPSSAYSATALGRLQSLPSATGQCDSAIELVPDSDGSAYSATVFVAAASNASQAISLLTSARDIGVDQLKTDTASIWRQVLDQAALPDLLPPDVRGRCRDALATILICVDRASGAIIRSPSTQPPLALNWARHAAWINLALDAVKFQPVAMANLSFLSQSIHDRDASIPLGSMPAALYSDGSPAFPEFLVDIDNTGWLLWSAHQHYRVQPPDLAQAEIAPVWPKLAMAADFLAGWADPRDGAPLHSFDWASLHDAQRPRNALVAFLGLDAACKLAQVFAEEVPPLWTRRRNELDVWIQLRQLHGREHWAPKDEVVFWLTEQVRRPWSAPESVPASGTARQILNPSDPHWAAAADALLDTPTPEAIRDAAWLTFGVGERVVSVDALRTYNEPFKDALDAANYVLAALAVAGEVSVATPPNSP